MNILQFSPRRLRLRAVSLVAAALVLPAATLWADGAVARPARVRVTVEAPPGQGNTALSALIADSISAELSIRGIDALSSDEPPAGTGKPGLRRSPDFAIQATYETTGSTIHLDASWVDLASGQAVGHATRSGELNLSFDSLVAGLVDELVDGQKARIALLPPDPPVQEIPDTTAEGPPRSPVPALAPARPAREPKLSALSFSAGTAPFIATFTALNYFPLGVSVTVDGHYRFRALGGFLGVGLKTGLSGFHGRGEYAQADFYVFPIGLDVVYGTLTGSRVDFFLHANAGPSILTAKQSSGVFLAKVIPYAQGGVGVTWAMFDGFALSLDLSYTAFFDSTSVIAGFTPSLSAELRL